MTSSLLTSTLTPPELQAEQRLHLNVQTETSGQDRLQRTILCSDVTTAF